MKKTILIGVLVLGAIGAITAYLVYNKPHKNMEKAAADIALEAETLFTAYKTDEQAADAQYLDKVVQVSGTVKGVSQEGGKTSVTLDSGDQMSGVVCELDELTKHPRTDFQVGEQVTFKGMCTGFLLDVVLVRCVEVQ
jgi:gas vesicle protein